MGKEGRWSVPGARGPHAGPGAPGLGEMEAARSPQTQAPEESPPSSQEGARLGEGRQFRA